MRRQLLTCRMTTRPICRAASGQIDSGCAVNIDRIQHGRLSASVRRLIRQARFVAFRLRLKNGPFQRGRKSEHPLKELENRGPVTPKVAGLNSSAVLADWAVAVTQTVRPSTYPELLRIIDPNSIDGAP
jgi:hypothetical protein